MDTNEIKKALDRNKHIERLGEKLLRIRRKQDATFCSLKILKKMLKKRPLKRNEALGILNKAMKIFALQNKYSEQYEIIFQEMFQQGALIDHDLGIQNKNMH